MLPDPIHPAIVHFPIVLALFLPLAVLGAFLLARRGFPIRSVWSGVVATAALLAGSAWLAVETGEGQEERVERAVSEGALDTHQERATVFLYLAAGTLVLTGAGLSRGRLGRAGRVAAAIGALVLVPAIYLVGDSGGKLVYKYGAAQAYAGPADRGAGTESRSSERAGAQGKTEDKDRE